MRKQHARPEGLAVLANDLLQGSACRGILLALELGAGAEEGHVLLKFFLRFKALKEILQLGPAFLAQVQFGYPLPGRLEIRAFCQSGPRR